MDARAQSETYKRVLVSQSHHAQLLQQGLLEDHFHRQGEHFVLEWSAAECAMADQSGITYEVLVQDLSAWYQARAAANPALPRDGSTGGPSGFHLGSMAGYLTYQEVLDELDMMAINYPNLITARDSIGVTYEGRAIWAVKISDHPNVHEDEPAVLYTALHHAREPISLMQMMYFMHALLEGYGQDSLSTWLINERTMVFVPVVNPDGYIHNQNIQPNGGGMWRKNRRVHPSSGIGVDLNRNYGFEWGYDDNGSSPSPSSNTYRGSGPFSESETEAIRQLAIRYGFETGMSTHGYGEYMIYPWGYDQNVPLTTLDVYGRFSEYLIEKNHFYSGRTMETVGYTANGVMDDYMHGEVVEKPLAYHFSPECGTSDDGFWPAPNRIEDICEGMLKTNYRIAAVAGACLEPESISALHYAGQTVSLPVRVRNLGLIGSSDFQARLRCSHAGVMQIQPALLTCAGIAPNNYSDLQFDLSFAPGITPGTEIECEVEILTDGGVTKTLEIEFIFGSPAVLFAENAEGHTNAWNGNWGITQERAAEGANSFTDSPWMAYPNMANNTFSTLQPISLTGYTHPWVRFQGFWEVDHRNDYVQLLASSDGINFTSVQTTWSYDGVGLNQPTGEPVFEGHRYEWVEVRAELDDFEGGDLYLQFALHSDSWGMKDGFYFDDLEVMAFQSTVGRDIELQNQVLLLPNPSNGDARVITHTGTGPFDLEMMDVQGRVVLKESASNGQQIKVSNLPSGVYFYRTNLDNQIRKWVKQ